LLATAFLNGLRRAEEGLRIGRCASCGKELKLGEPRIRVILKDGKQVNKTYCMRCYDKLHRKGKVNTNGEK